MSETSVFTCLILPTGPGGATVAVCVRKHDECDTEFRDLNPHNPQLDQDVSISAI